MPTGQKYCQQWQVFPGSSWNGLEGRWCYQTMSRMMAGRTSSHSARPFPFCMPRALRMFMSVRESSSPSTDKDILLLEQLVADGHRGLPSVEA